MRQSKKGGTPKKGFHKMTDGSRTKFMKAVFGKVRFEFSAKDWRAF